MPGIRLHLTVARELAIQFQSPVVDAERGAYYLGATTPDIRALTRWDRERTHFFKLDEFGEQSGVHRLLEEEPRLRNAAALDSQTAAFMAGYISHLVLDEDYICQVYRPLFGQHSLLRDDAMAEVMDKVLQWDIEREGCNDRDKVEEIRTAMAEAAVDVGVDFIARDVLEEWRGISLDIIGTQMSVDRLVQFLRRRVPQLEFEDEETQARFAEAIPPLLARTWAHVGEERVREYLSGTKSRALRAMKEYLS
ncbi:MAG: zinc dependent phospholipase C family protein [Dehalococcoidia bacterium]